VDKNAMLEQIIRSLCKVKAVVITKTKRSADELEAYLQTRDINAMSVHSNKGKQACEAGAKAFNEDEIDILITTDMILQSLALTGIEYMLGYDLPVEAEHYLSRIGCMSEAGEAISLVSKEEETLLFLIERKMRQEIVQEELEGFIPTPESEQILTRHRTHTKKPRHKKTKSKEKEGSKEQKE
jgi:superfamily II DNA/RNA helicase